MACNEYLGGQVIALKEMCIPCVTGVAKALGLGELTGQLVSVQARLEQRLSVKRFRDRKRFVGVEDVGTDSKPCRSFREQYQVDQCELLGTGGFGNVYKSFQSSTGKEVAVKVLQKEIDLNLIVNELRVLMQLDHPNVLCLHEYFEDDHSVHVVTDLATGGDLNVLVKKPDNEVNDAFRQLMQAIAYLHQQHIAHRDVKPENCLFLSESREVLKVIDFGLAVVRKADDQRENFMQGCVGTPNYMSPEMIDGSKGYGVHTDVWSAGILLHFLLVGEHAFAAKPCGDQKQLFTKIRTWSWDAQALIEHDVDAQAQDLISQMLLKEPAKRPRAQDVLGHPWLRAEPLAMAVIKGTSGEVPNSHVSHCKSFSTVLGSRIDSSSGKYFDASPETSSDFGRNVSSSSSEIRSNIRSDTESEVC